MGILAPAPPTAEVTFSKLGFPHEGGSCSSGDAMGHMAARHMAGGR